MGRFTKPVTVALKIAVAVGLLWVLVNTKLVDFSILATLKDHPVIVVMVMISVLLSYVSGAYRWLIFLKTQGFTLSFWQVFHANILGAFSSIFLPGGSSGEGIRILLAMKLAHKDRARAVLTVFGDRLMALFTLSVWACFAALSGWDHMTGSLRPIAYGMAIAPLCFLAGALVLVELGRRYRVDADGVQPAGRMMKLLASVTDFLAIVRSKPGSVALAFVISMLSTGFVLAAFLLVSQIYTFPYLGLMDYLRAAPIAMLVNSVPLSPGGLGVGEAAFGRICNLMAGNTDPVPYGTIYLTYRLLAIPVAAYGIVPLLNFRSLLAEPQASV